ncbi:MAG: hypothetical protein SFU98_16580 [Leptospiraceae bacterium]|nr:hypothetical protein [Leptospiraceae bacterium]
MKFNLEHTNLQSILDSDVNVEELMNEIEASLSARNIDESDIRRIAELDSSPLSPSEREFDPANTAYLFDKGISPPKFTNPALRFIKGPLKWIVIKLVEFYALLDKKLSENRIRAFYAVVHELILQKAKMKRVESELSELRKEFQDIKTELLKQKPTEFKTYRRPFDDRTNEIQKFILKKIPSHESLQVLVLESQDDSFLFELQKRSITYHLCLLEKSSLLRFENFDKKKISIVNDLKNISDLTKFNLYIFENNLCLYPPYQLESLIYEFAELTSMNSKFILFFSNHSQKKFTAFQEVYPTFIFIESLVIRLKELGFSNIITETISQMGYTIISFEKK